jgi:hypothetical protein
VTAVAVAAVVGLGCRRRHALEPEWVAAGCWAMITNPLLTAATVVTVAARRRWKVATRARARLVEADADVTLLADLLALAMRAGLSIRAACEQSAARLHPLLRSDVAELVTAMDQVGVGPALGRGAGRLEGVCRVIEGAAASGAPPADALAALADRLRHERHTAAVAATRRLPVRLLLPLALLILPGFVILTVGPAVLQAVARLNPAP